MAKEEAKLPEGITIIPPDRECVSYESVLNINFYKKGAPFFGSLRGMRFRLAMDEVKEETGEEEKEAKTRFRLSLWDEPLSYETADPDSIRDFYFEFSEEGRRQAVDRINEEYQRDKMHWHDAEENGIRRLLNRKGEL
ncbi:MAG: hypothetical protein J6O71_03185 [Lachnospiraceae bacterium]|nr:hypothetical protein [Lachnospiraceae bacterium]